jgi:hypothetical protein
VGPWRYRFAEDRVRDKQPSPDEVAALRDAVLAWHQELAREALEAADSRAWRWLELPRMLAGLVRMLAVGRPPAFLVADEEAARLYQRLRGIDPQLARAEVWRMSEQLGSLDQRLLGLEADRPGRPPGADRAELEAAAGALAAWYLQGRRGDDELLGEVEAAWAAVEEAQAQQEGVPAGLPGPGLRAWLEATDERDEREEAAIDRYVAAWRRWLDRQAPWPASAGGAGAGSRLVEVPRDAPRQPVSAEELAALREAVLAWQEGLNDPVAASRSMRLVGWLSGRHLGWLALPWQLLLAARIVRLAGRSDVTASHDHAVALYRRRSGRDPEIARAEVDRLGVQLVPLGWAGYDGRGAGRASRAELEAATEALLGWYLAGRRSDDGLLGEVMAAWAAVEELDQQALEALRRRGLLGARRAERQRKGLKDALRQRYVLAWRRWLEEQPPQGSTADQPQR